MSGRCTLTSDAGGVPVEESFLDEPPVPPPLPFAADSRWMAMETLPPPEVLPPLPPTAIEYLGGGGIDRARSRSRMFQTLAFARVVSLEDLHSGCIHSQSQEQGRGEVPGLPVSEG